MIKVTGLNELAKMVEERNRIENEERELRKRRTKELVAQGIDREIAKVMSNIEWEYNI